MLRTYLEQALQASGADGAPALMLHDLDNFKIINDSCGHTAGNEFVVEVARKLKMFSDRAAWWRVSVEMNSSS